MSLRALAVCLATGLLVAIFLVRSEWDAVVHTSTAVHEPVRSQELDPPPLASQREVAASPEVAAPLEPLGTVTIEVRVLERGSPLAGAEVELLRLDDDDHGFLVGESPAVAAASARTDGAGLVHFEREPPGRRGVRAIGPEGSAARVPLLLGVDATLVRLAISLGGAGLEGTVHAPSGAGAPACRVLVRQDPAAGESQAWFLARTDGAGNYRVGGLAGGPERRVSAAVLDLRLPETKALALGLDEWRRVDFGSPAGRARWSGVVRLASGAVVAGPARLFLVERDSSAVQATFFDEAGRFDVELPAGRYEARLSDLGGLAIGEARVSGVLEEDLVLPGAAVRGRVRYVGAVHPLAKGPENEVALTLEREDGAPRATALLRGDGRYAFLGLEPGAYTLSASPWVPAEGSGGSVRIEIPPGVEELVHDLDITDP